MITASQANITDAIKTANISWTETPFQQNLTQFLRPLWINTTALHPNATGTGLMLNEGGQETLYGSADRQRVHMQGKEELVHLQGEGECMK